MGYTNTHPGYKLYTDVQCTIVRNVYTTVPVIDKMLIWTTVSTESFDWTRGVE